MDEIDVDGSGAVELTEFAANGHHFKANGRKDAE